jgi:hypothetical protein
MLGLVDPVLDQAGGSDVAMLVTKGVVNRSWISAAMRLFSSPCSASE